MIVYRSCAAVEKDTRFLDRYHILFSSIDDARFVLEETLADLTDIAGTEDVIFTFSDKENWRKLFVDSEYKNHRVGDRKPLAYWSMIDEINAKYDVVTIPQLEADDVLGVLQTGGKHGDTIIWSLDKDLKQIPGKHIVDDEVITITEEEADRFHLFQTLTGDPADGYKGCPGIGKVKAEANLSPEALAKAGMTPWQMVVHLYEKAGMSESDALTQARLARILRSTDYKEDYLWTPTT